MENIVTHTQYKMGITVRLIEYTCKFYIVRIENYYYVDQMQKYLSVISEGVR